MAPLLYRVPSSPLSAFRIARSPFVAVQTRAYDELPDNRPRRFVEPICACRFLQPGNPLARKFGEQSGQCRASDDQVMRGEHRPYFVVATLGVKKLAPGKYIRPFQENNL